MPLDKLFANLSNPNARGSAIGDLFSSPGAQGALGGALSGGAVSLMMNKKARKAITKNAAKVGGAAAVAGIGYLAYSHWQQRRTATGAGAAVGAADTVRREVPSNLEQASEHAQVTAPLQVKMILAMIAAASSDGNVDDQEMDALMAAIEGAPLGSTEKSELTAALNTPHSVEEIAVLVSGPEEAAEVYGAALSAIDVDTPAEHLFLRRFAKALKLDPDLVSSIHETVAA